MPLHWVIVHPIGPDSPLRGLSREALIEAEPELVCLVSGHDETFAQTVHAKTSYDTKEIVWGGRFTDMYISNVDHVAIDLSRLHHYDEVVPPDIL